MAPLLLEMAAEAHHDPGMRSTLESRSCHMINTFSHNPAAIAVAVRRTWIVHEQAPIAVRSTIWA